MSGRESKVDKAMNRAAQERASGAKAPDLFEAESARLKSCPDTSCSCGSATAMSANVESSPKPMTLEAVRRELSGAKGKKYWRSLDELANTPEFQAAVEREFPSAAQEWVDPVSRRGFLKLMGASMALGGSQVAPSNPMSRSIRISRRLKT